MTERVQHIYADNLEERLPIPHARDEIGRLALTFNDLLSRLQTTFQKERQFMADAAHELRTPLYVVRTAVDVTLKQARRSEAEYREALQMVSQQERRLTCIVEDLFLLGCAADGGCRLQTSDFYLDELIQDTVKVIGVLAREKGVAIETVVIPGTCFHGDEALLRQMLLNLLDNAVKYIPSGAKIIVTLQVIETAVWIEVADNGPGIPSKMQDHIFERFYRGDQARSHRDKGMGAGAGLGLPIARWIAEAHGGTIVLSRSDSQGSLFSITLPRTNSSEN
jgi:two-component system, OmpR family, sensor kinase